MGINLVLAIAAAFAVFVILIEKHKKRHSMSIIPLNNRVIVKPADSEEKTASGIIIPETARERPNKGVVIAAGPGFTDQSLTVKAGDEVLYGKYAGTELTIDSPTGPVACVIMREDDILCIINPPKQ